MRFLTISVLSVSALLASRGGDLRDHAQQATQIVLGEVTGNRSYYGNDGDIYTEVTINVSATLKDTNRKSARLRTFTVKGGTVGGTSVMFTDVPTFGLSESVVVFFDGDAPSEKYSFGGERAGKLLSELEQALDDQNSPIAEGERQRARTFLSGMAAAQMAAAQMAAAPVAATPAPTDAACYALIGPKWTGSLATYKYSATIPRAWQPALEASSASWNRAGTPFVFRADPASTNEFLVGPVSGATTLASTRIEYDSTNRMRRFTMTFSNAVSWSPTGEAGKFDVESVTAHELGHALGLNHPSATGCSEQTLWASAATSELKKRTLENGDKAGIAKLYTVATSTPPTTPNTPLVAPAPVFSSAALFPALPRAGQEFAIWLVGTGFDPATVQIVVNGPGCPSSCLASLPYRAATLFSGVVALGTRGAYTIAIRNGPTGALSATKPLTIQ